VGGGWGVEASGWGVGASGQSYHKLGFYIGREGVLGNP